MRDTGLIIGLICGTFAASILMFYAWGDRKKYPPLFEKSLYVIIGMLAFLWASTMVMWFSV